MIIKQCKECGKNVTRRQFRGKNTFCSHKCRQQYYAKIIRGENHPNWKGGKTQEKSGYILIRKPEHHRARKSGYVLEHILVMEDKIGRHLKIGEVVHHINHNPADNRPENLRLYSSNKEHIKKENHKRKKHLPCPCGLPHHANGYCNRHNRQLSETGQVWDLENRLIRKNRPKFCHCGQPVVARDMCNKHYLRWQKENKGTNRRPRTILGVK